MEFPDIEQYNDVYQYIYDNILNGALASIKGKISANINKSIQDKNQITFEKYAKKIRNKLIESLKQFNLILQNGDYDYDKILQSISPDKRNS